MSAFKKWFSANWYDLVLVSSKVLYFLAIVFFAGSLLLYFAMGFNTLLGIKIAAAFYIAGGLISSLKGLK